MEYENMNADERRDYDRWPPRPGSARREGYEWRVASARAAAREPEEEAFFVALNAARRPTGDDTHDLNELGRMLLWIAAMKRRDYREGAEFRIGRPSARRGKPDGRSKFLAKAKEVCHNAAGRIVMRRLTGHPAPYSEAEYRQKDAHRQDIFYGRAEPTIGRLRDFDGSPAEDDDYD